VRRLLFDTTFLVDVERSGEALDNLIDDDDDVAVAAITIAEVRVGVELSRGRRRRARQDFLDDILAEVPVIDYDLDVADAHARLLVAVRQQGRPRGAHDLIIAATAVATRRMVVSSDNTAFTDLRDVVVRSHGDHTRPRRDDQPT
jgi:tRNA(fMet)-specific endonuclease VapC